MERRERAGRGQPLFITFEGGEGTGKSTQVALLAERLRAVGREVRTTREPGGTPLAEAIRAVLLHPDAARDALAAAGLLASEAAAALDDMLPATEALLLSAARVQHVARIRTWLAAGADVLSDRYADATRVYQGAARGLDPAPIAALERIATGGLVPDRTILLDLPVAEGQRRRAAARDSGGDWNRLDAETADFHERVRSGYLALAAADSARWVVVDAAGDVAAVAEAVWRAVEDGQTIAEG